MKFYTSSGSVYEVDVDHKMIRRLSAKQPSPRAKLVDGEWMPFKKMEPIKTGEHAYFVMNDSGKWLQTSRVTKIES